MHGRVETVLKSNFYLSEKMDSLVLLTVHYNLSGKWFKNWTILKAERKTLHTTLKDNKFHCRID